MFDLPGCISWPAPDLSTFPCGGSIPAATITDWEPVATEQIYHDTGSRFPGTACTADLRICKSCTCQWRCVGSCEPDRVDLRRVIRWPILELQSVTVAGTADPGLLDDFRIESRRWLAIDHDTVAGWPEDNLQVRPGETGSVVWRVRYGEEPPVAVVKARDQLLYTMIMANAPPQVNGCRIVGPGEVEFTENGRTFKINTATASALRASVTSQWERKRPSVGVADPAVADIEGRIELVEVP